MKIYFNNCSDHDFLYAGVYYRSKTQTEVDGKLHVELVKNRRVKQNISKGLFFITEIKDKKKPNEKEVKPILLNPEQDIKIDKVFK